MKLGHLRWLVVGLKLIQLEQKKNAEKLKSILFWVLKGTWKSFYGKQIICLFKF